MSRAKLAIAITLCSIIFGPGAVQAADRPILAELFTSLGCSSCPPADSVLGELAGRPDILALSFHVDYWDGLGWKDPFSLHLATLRQRQYGESLGSEIYTPQLVIDGQAETVGSDRRNVAALLRSPRGESVPATIQETNGRFDIRIDGASGPTGAVAATILLVTFDAAHKTPVRGGENGGRLLETFNDVRSLRPIGVWRGQAFTLDAARGDSDVGERAAVIVQSDDGAVWALAATKAAS